MSTQVSYPYLTPTMMVALIHMVNDEDRYGTETAGTHHRVDAADIGTPASYGYGFGFGPGCFIKSNTAIALEKRGLALRVRCCWEYSCKEIELQFTAKGREVARNLQAFLNKSIGGKA